LQALLHGAPRWIGRAMLSKITAHFGTGFLALTLRPALTAGSRMQSDGIYISQ
jgi:hypothetical protein